MKRVTPSLCRDVDLWQGPWNDEKDHLQCSPGRTFISSHEIHRHHERHNCDPWLTTPRQERLKQIDKHHHAEDVALQCTKRVHILPSSRPMRNSCTKMLSWCRRLDMILHALRKELDLNTAIAEKQKSWSPTHLRLLLIVRTHKPVKQGFVTMMIFNHVISKRSCYVETCNVNRFFMCCFIQPHF